MDYRIIVAIVGAVLSLAAPVAVDAETLPGQGQIVNVNDAVSLARIRGLMERGPRLSMLTGSASMLTLEPERPRFRTAAQSGSSGGSGWRTATGWIGLGMTMAGAYIWYDIAEKANETGRYTDRGSQYIAGGLVGGGLLMILF